MFVRLETPPIPDRRIMLEISRGNNLSWGQVCASSKHGSYDKKMCDEDESSPTKTRSASSSFVNSKRGGDDSNTTKRRDSVGR